MQNPDGSTGNGISIETIESVRVLSTSVVGTSCLQISMHQLKQYLIKYDWMVWNASVYHWYLYWYL